MNCHDCKQEIETGVFITCSAHKNRSKVCMQCWDARDEAARDNCVEDGCHGRVHAVKKSRVLRSLHYFKQHAKKAAMIAFALLVFLLVSVLCAIPFAAIEKMAEMEEQEKVSASYLFFYMFQMLIYLVVWLVISMIFGLEWIEDRSNSFRNNIRQHSMHFIAASMYVVQLAFCALLFFAPTWKFTIAQHAWMVFLLLDAFYLFLLRRWILSILSEAVQQTYDWFMEEQEEHLFLAEEFNE